MNNLAERWDCFVDILFDQIDTLQWRWSLFTGKTYWKFHYVDNDGITIHWKMPK